jgi:voltage-gated sodium channel
VPLAQPVIGSLYFVSFVVLGTMIMLNLVIGVIINSMQEAHDDQLKSEPLPDNANTAETLAHMENELDRLRADIRRLRKAMK